MSTLAESARMAQCAVREDWSVSMCWRDLLFAHWPVRPETLRPLVPEGLEIDTYAGHAWVGIVPFHLTIRYRWMPLSVSFPEVNVRTYVRRGEESGVWFLSLDAQSRAAVAIARRRYGLPYHHARISMRSQMSDAGPLVDLRSDRRSRRRPPAALQLKYRPTGGAFMPEPGSLEHWLVERYHLFAAKSHGRIARGEIYHPPWQLQTAIAEFRVNRLFEPLGLERPEESPLLHYCNQIDAVAWKLKRNPV